MTLAIAFKGPEGIVLAADSRVTLEYQMAPAVQGQPIIQGASHYDHGTKLLKAVSQTHIAAVTYGVAVLDMNAPRTAHSYMPEFEATLTGRLTVQEFATQLGAFFAPKFHAANLPANSGDMAFLVGGYDDDEPYGRVFEVKIPSAVAPVELNAGQFGLAMGGQTDISVRLLQHLPIPYQFLPLQDCIDLSILLIKTTSDVMKYMTALRGVGGAIDVATITTQGVVDVQIKRIQGER